MLFEPLPLQNFIIPNRIVVSPMCQYTAVHGYAKSWHLAHLGQFAIGRAGAVIQEATAVRPEGRISYGDMGLWEDGQIEPLKEITTFIKSQGSIPGIQLAHAGRKASTDKPWIGKKQFKPNEEHGWQTVAPSPIPYYPDEHAPKELTIAEIKDLVQAFQDAARRAVIAGFQIIELHAAHGYLIHQFLSPLCNFRTDEYGGSFDNRIRFLEEIVSSVKAVLGDTHSLWVRISATDWASGGWDEIQSIELVKRLQSLGVEVMDISSGGAVREQRIDVGPGYQVPFATAIKKATGIVTGAVGLITNAGQAQEILEQGAADFVLIGRSFLRNPHLVLQWAKDLDVPIAWPVQYERAKAQ
ncbi:NADH:flavin oxidoreductase/NADH oxidase [Sphingobacterium kyonggiense]